MTSSPRFDSHVTVVVPVYNGAQSIALLVKEVRRVIAPMVRRLDFILINDASRDESWLEIETLARAHEDVTSINLTRNFGQHAALACGFKHATGDIVVTMDDDLQHPPAEIEKLLAGLEGDYDVVYGVPAEEVHGTWRDLASVISKFTFQKMLGMENARDTSAFRAIRANVLAPLRTHSAPFIDVDAMLTWTTSRFLVVVTRHEDRRFGSSNYSLFKLLSHAVNMVVSYTTVPLRLASITGFVFSLFGVTVMAFVLGRYLIAGAAVPGFAFLACIIALFSGAQLFALGLLGEYFAKLHFRVMGRPGAVEREIVTAKP